MREACFFLLFFYIFVVTTNYCDLILLIISYVGYTCEGKQKKEDGEERDKCIEISEEDGPS